MSKNKKKKVDLLTEKMMEFKAMQGNQDELDLTTWHEYTNPNMKRKTPKKQWEIVDKLYTKETKILDHNLNALHDYIKP